MGEPDVRRVSWRSETDVGTPESFDLIQPFHASPVAIVLSVYIDEITPEVPVRVYGAQQHVRNAASMAV